MLPSGWHDKVARTLGRGFRKLWRFYFDKSFSVQIVADKLNDFMSKAHIPLHARTTKVEVTVLEACLFPYLMPITSYINRWCLGFVDNTDRKHLNLHLPVRLVLVNELFRSFVHLAGNGNDPLGTNLICQLVCLCMTRKRNHLHFA